MLPEVIESERLRFEPRTPEYVDPLRLYELCKRGAPGIDEVTRYVPWDPHPHPKESYDFLRRGRKRWDDREAANYVLRLRTAAADADEVGDVVGFTGIGLDWEKETATLGLWIRRRFWGRGFSGERAVALAALAFDRLDLDLLAVSHDPDNEQSERAIEKYVEEMGGRREGTLRNWGDGDPPTDLVRYSVSQAEWADAALDPDVTFYDEYAEAPEPARSDG